ncbi:hypothetical protein [Antrihabitans cavernicola]|uniref:Uncharacterized protein n=1 Tax=Antrihabitans cavernicola TaxID=2495913 RepID=A0A5A7S7N8_9NOCA|nr:hypothetical protein [Spelaeibacter cavernicola]KAA0021162.1 hypothetical protein FOY51_19795 [Spelaeibacter cavernicola]
MNNMMMRTRRDQRFWMVATWSVAGLMVLEAMVVMIVWNVTGDDPNVPLSAFLVATGVSILAAGLLWWRTTGVGRAVSAAAAATAGLWTLASLLLTLLYLSYGASIR